MSASPILDESVFKKWNSISKLESLENFSFADMKGPSNVSVRLDLFPEHKSHSNKMEFNSDEKIKDDDSEFSKWNETEQLNNQVVFINPEWDEIEEEKAGIPTFLSSITPNISNDKPVPPQVTEFVVTDNESVSSVTVSLDEFAEESEEIVAVISDSEAEVIQAELLTQMDGQVEEKSPKTVLDQFPVEELQMTNWKGSDNIKPLLESDLPFIISQNDKNKSPTNQENFKKRGGELLDTSKLMKASCYVMQNGKITKPFYIVKNPVLREDAVYKNINRIDNLAGKRGIKIQNVNTTPEEDQNLLPLGRNTFKKKDTFREPQPNKIARNQDFIRIIEHPARAKKIIMNKMGENKNHQGINVKRPNADNAGGGLGRSQSLDTMGNFCEGEDLMWLLDFKLDDLFSESSLQTLSQLDDNLEQYTEFPGKFVDVDGSVSNFSESDADDKIRANFFSKPNLNRVIPPSFCVKHQLQLSGLNGPMDTRCKFSRQESNSTPVEIGCQTETMTTRPNKVSSSKVNGGKQHHKVEAKSESALPNRTFSDLKCSENRKPPFTYTELIECALQEKGPLTVSEIYNWISETFPYYKSWDDRWKNSVRHNLSINPYFRKGTKARQGSGHLWTVNKTEDNSKINNWKRHRFHEFEEFSKRLRYTGESEKQEEASDCVSPNGMIDETELATASIEDKENRRLHRDVLMAACIDNNFISTANVSLEQSAEEILSGVKKNVEVQYLEPVKSPCEDDFLNPISKEILMGECGLLNQIELNLTAETGEHLSIVDGMTDSEHIFGIPDELNFHYDIPSHTPQLLPLAK